MQEPSVDAVVRSVDFPVNSVLEGHSIEYLDKVADDAERAWRDLCTQYGITHNDYLGNYFRQNPDGAKD